MSKLEELMAQTERINDEISRLEELKLRKKELVAEIKKIRPQETEIVFRNLKFKSKADKVWEEADANWVVNVQYLTCDGKPHWSRIIRQGTREEAIAQIHELAENLFEFEKILKEN